MKKFFIFCLLSAVHFGALGQIKLPTYTIYNDSFLVVIDDFDYIEFDNVVNHSINGPHFFACPISLGFNMRDVSRKIETEEGSIHYLTIKSKDALGLSVSFSKLEFSDGSFLKIYSKYDSANSIVYTKENSRSFNFLSETLFDSEIVLFLYEPIGYEYSIIHLDRLNHSFSNPNGGFENSCSDQVDVVCSPEGDQWKKEKNSAVMLAIDGVGFCSGTLVNNTLEDGKPLILTSDHCYAGFDFFKTPQNEQMFSSKADLAFNTEIWFNYQSPWCNGSQSVDHVLLKHSTIRAEWTSSDFILLEINSQIPTSFYAYYAGWNREDIPNQPIGGVGIHHPSGDVKKISTHTRSLVNSTCMTQIQILGSSPPTFYPSNAHFFRVDFWDNTLNGTSKPEGGSSGSGLFNSDNRLIGNLFGSDCAIFFCLSKNGTRTNRTTQAANYGKIFSSWTGGGTPNTSLSDWLAPPLGIAPPNEFFGLRYIRYYTINHDAWYTGDVVKFHDVNILSGFNVVVTELQDKFEVTGEFVVPVGSTFQVNSP